MKIATLLFTYNRSYHTEQVISSLKQNTVLPKKLFIFQDGLKKDADEDEWKKVNNLIHNIDWCDNAIIVSEYNKGLSESILYGVNYAFREYDAVIVLEDDCVATPNFISFMTQCFTKYEKDKNVYSISGYSWPIGLKKGQYDIYGCGRISSWGWGTWKDRWSIYEKDYELVKRMKQEEKTSQDLAMWGSDLEDTVVGNVRGTCDSWAVFWALNVIAKEGICINPYESLIRNIGTDGSGVHCGSTDKFEVNTIDGEKEDFYLPDKIEVLDEVKEAFAGLYGSYTAAAKTDEIRESVLVYGAGNFYFQNEKLINGKYNVIAFIDRRKHGWLAGRKVLKLNEIGRYKYGKILVAIQNIQECSKIAQDLVDMGISSDAIIYVHNIIKDGE